MRFQRSNHRCSGETLYQFTHDLNMHFFNHYAAYERGGGGGEEANGNYTDDNSIFFLAQHCKIVIDFFSALY